MESLWLNVDMCLDARQTYLYYEHSFHINGTYSKWCLENKNVTTNEICQELVSPDYFYVATVIWILPPFLLSTLRFITSGLYKEEYNPLLNSFSVMQMLHSLELKPLYERQWIIVILYWIYFPCDLVVSFIIIYFVIPFAAFKAGIIVALNGKIDPNLKVVKNMDMDHIPFWLFFEHLAEAIPQAILSLIFLINHFQFLMHADTLILPIPTTLISLFTSTGSIVMGLYTGCQASYHTIQIIRI